MRRGIRNAQIMDIVPRFWAHVAERQPKIGKFAIIAFVT
jgi:hypothetical protein